jgi:tetratricopeptide (TPR) repeat protein
MEDQFKLLNKNIMQFFQQGDITKARDEYERLISYQTQKVTDNPESYKEKARLGSSLAIITYIDDQLAVDKKLLLLGEGISLFEDIMSKTGDNLEPEQQLLFCDLLDFRGRTLYNNRIFDSAIEDFNEAIKLYRGLKVNLKPRIKAKLPILYVLRATALFANNRNRVITNTCLKDVNEAISILELIRKSSPEVFNADFQLLLPRWYKLRDVLKSRVSLYEKQARGGAYSEKLAKNSAIVFSLMEGREEQNRQGCALVLLIFLVGPLMLSYFFKLLV